jgi:hypothetical protein
MYREIYLFWRKSSIHSLSFLCRWGGGGVNPLPIPALLAHTAHKYQEPEYCTVVCRLILCPIHIFIKIYTSVADPDLGSGALFFPGSGMENNPDPGSGINIPDHILRAYSNNYLG